MQMKREKARHTFCCVDCVLPLNSHLCKEVSFLTISLNTELSGPPNNWKVFEEMESPFEYQRDLTQYFF